MRLRDLPFIILALVSLFSSGVSLLSRHREEVKGESVQDKRTRDLIEKVAREADATAKRLEERLTHGYDKLKKSPDLLDEDHLVEEAIASECMKGTRRSGAAAD
jgi:hypothetical protein